MVRVSFKTYCTITILLTGVVIYRAYEKYQQFYLTGLYLATAKHALLIFTNLVAVLAYLLGKLFVYIYLDRIHERELDLLNDKIKSSLTDTILALTIFREHFNTQFVFLLLFLLFFQVFHWLSKYRVEYLEHSPYDLKKNIKLVALLSFLLLVDSAFLYFSITSLFREGPNVMVLFSLEFGLLLITGISTLIQLFINIEGIKREGRWDNKGLYLLYLEFFSEGLKTLLYGCFFAITIIHYGIPIHIIRQLFLSIRTFCRRLQDILQYQNIMNERFPDATEEELENTDKICIVCREDMLTGKKLPCGHILHLHCLRSWLERQQTCPICRANVIIQDPNNPNPSLLQRLFGRRQPRPAVQQQQAQPQPIEQQAQQQAQQQGQPQPLQPLQPPLHPPFGHQPLPPFDNPFMPPNIVFPSRRRVHFSPLSPPPPLIQNLHFNPFSSSHHHHHHHSSTLPPFLLQSTNSTTTTAPTTNVDPNIAHIEQIQQHITFLSQQLEIVKNNIYRSSQNSTSQSSLPLHLDDNIINNNTTNINNNNSTNEIENNNNNNNNISENIKPNENTTSNTTTTTTTTTTTSTSSEKSMEQPTVESSDEELSYEDQMKQRVARYKNSPPTSTSTVVNRNTNNDNEKYY
ncbi:hypothetical protein DLAC_06051 [Tieghemostelium lacteum]|uniref:RING-type E3 ubiquitin transferase n=1 Tax=Tieghemostelium lacteum TaxID=361077 RepID=A0A151ZHP3_TIELA|nr:hypothetical protein DLAC_06051 [Tieghemostelium lacteum]|eukprot:KYQ93374.1 hypothetical protein DLAC_06051 [Tieghemostelium lacteum]